MAVSWNQCLLLLLPLFFVCAFSEEANSLNRLGFGIRPGHFKFLPSHPGWGFNLGHHPGHQDGDDSHLPQQGVPEKPDFQTKSLGAWKVDNPNAGVSAMQLQLMPNGKVVWFDTTNLGPSAIEFDPKWCRDLPDHKKDCFAHAIEYDPQTSNFRTLKFMSDPWCSCGGLAANGDLISTGGAIEGMKAVRILSPCENCEFQENQFALAADRWYSSQQFLEDGSIIVVGGRKSFSYEIVPPTPLNFKQKLFNFPFLQETTDEKENNLYPFLYLLPDGNVYLFANSRSIILNPYNAQIIRELPELPGGARNYPASAMSALLPLKLSADNNENIPAEVIVCGGNTKDAAKYSEFVPRKFFPALKDCNRMIVTDENPVWDKEDMPSKRVMGDMLHLPNGDLLMLNGAKKGTAAWYAAEEPNFTPVLYSPNKPKGRRMKNLKSTQIARMYHSSSALLPDGQILVAGSNPNQYYNFTSKYPTELRVEKFSPPYLAPELEKFRPVIVEGSSDKELKYGQPFAVYLNLKAEVDESDIKVTMIAAPFTTHGFSQNQRSLILGLTHVSNVQVTAVAPPSGKIAPAGYYMVFVVHRGVPSPGMWVHIE